MLVGLPSGAIAFTLTWIGALSPLYFPNSRCLIGTFLAAMPMLGSLLLLCLPAQNSWGIVVATWFPACSAPPLSIAVGLMASNLKGNTKKSVIGAIFFIFYCVGCISGPQLWQKQDAPRYFKGCIASVTSWGCLNATDSMRRRFRRLGGPTSSSSSCCSFCWQCCYSIFSSNSRSSLEVP